MALLIRNVIFVLLLSAVIFGESDAKRRGRRRRPVRKPRGPPVVPPIMREESRNVFYYDVPARTERPRIRDELDFSSLGISRPRGRGHPRPRYPKQLRSQSQYSLSALEQSYSRHNDDNSYYPEQAREAPPRFNKALPPPSSDYDDYPPEPVREPVRGPPKPRKRGRSRGPGYRLERPWQEHYVLTGNGGKQKKPNGPAVYPYIRQAGKSLAGAYKAAIIQSAKMAKFTGNAASKYFMGIRNLVAGNRDLGRSSIDEVDTQASTQSKQTSELEDMLVKTNLPEGLVKDDVVEIDLTKEATENGVLPKVYLDWGGSFWRFFYNKPNDIPAKSSSDE